MSRAGVVVVFAAVLATVWAVAALAASGSSPAKTHCSVRSVAVTPSGHVTALGNCDAAGRPAASKWRYHYLAYDDTAHVCGKGPGTTGSKSSFDVSPAGAYRVTGKMTVSAGTASASKTFAAVLGGRSLECGTMDNTSLPTNLCPWDGTIGGQQMIQESNYCGVPNKYAMWSSPPTLSDGVLDAGHIVSRSGSCTETLGKTVRQLVGFPIRQSDFRCADRMQLIVSIQFVLVDPSDHSWMCIGIAGGSAHMSIPKSWGGTLYVNVHLGAVAGMVDGGTRLDSRVENETAIFKLPGSDHAGCNGHVSPS